MKRESFVCRVGFPTVSFNTDWKRQTHQMGLRKITRRPDRKSDLSDSKITFLCVCVCELADCGQLIQCTCCWLWCVYSLSSPSAKPVPSLPGLSVFTQLITCSFPCCLLSVFAISLHPSIVCVVAFPASLRVSVCYSFMFLTNPEASKAAGVVISLS